MTKSIKAKIGLIGAGWWATANHLPVLEKRDDIQFAEKENLNWHKLLKGSDFSTLLKITGNCLNVTILMG